MSATLKNPTGPMWFSRPAAAAVASLAAVTFFIGLLGLGFLPREAQHLIDPHYVSVTHCVDMGAGRPTVSIFWSIPRFGFPGWRHHIAVEEANGTARPTFPFPQLRPLSVAKGADADHALVGNWDGAIYSFEPRNLNVDPVCVARQPNGPVIALASSNAGQCVLSQSAFHLHAWNPATQVQRWRRSDVAPYCFVVRPDNEAAILGTSHGELLEVDLQSGRTLRGLARYGSPLLAMSLSADGGKLAVLLADARLLLMDGRTGAPLWDQRVTRTCLTAAGRFVSFSPCGTLLVTADQDSATSLAVWSAATGQRLKALHGHDNVVIGAAFTQSGILRSWGADGTIRDWNLMAGHIKRTSTLAAPRMDI